MATQSGKSAPAKSVDKTPTKKPLARKVATVQSTRKKNEFTSAIKASQREKPNVCNQAPDHVGQTEPKFLSFEDLGARIARRAYALYEKRGRVHGYNFEDWYEAERQVLNEQGV